MGPLDRSLRVLEIGDRGEVAGKLLADAGADVVRVEPPDGASTRRRGPFVGDRPGTGASLRFAYLNTSKRGITLNPAHADGRALWQRLVARADVVIDSTGPGVLDAADAGYDSAQESSRLIWCSITPFGLNGPWRDWATNDLVSIALGGPMMSTGYDDHSIPPVRPDGEHSLAIAGEYAAIGIMAALLERRASGLGQLVDVSIHEAVACTVEGAFANWEYREELVQRQTGRHSSPNPTRPWQFECSDGEYVTLMGGGVPRDTRVWQRLVDWMDERGFEHDLNEPGRRDTIFESPRGPSPAREHVQDQVARFVQTLEAEAAYRGGQARHMPWGHVRRPEENLDDPHWADRGFFVPLEVPGHEAAARVPRAPYRFTDTPVEPRSRAPLLGEHNHEIYAGELDTSPATLTTLAQQRAI